MVAWIDEHLVASGGGALPGQRPIANRKRTEDGIGIEKRERMVQVHGAKQLNAEERDLQSTIGFHQRVSSFER
jgi:hypothetical protein